MWLQLKNLSFMMMIFRKKHNKDWPKQKKCNRKSRLHKKARDGSSRQRKRLQKKPQKLSLNQVHWHSLTAPYQMKPNNNNSRDTNPYKNQNKNKFTRKRNNNLSSRIRSKSKRGERKGKNNSNFSQPKFKL